MDSGSFGVRVGSAAFALGLGWVIAGNPGIALADDSDSGGRSPDSSQAANSAPSKPSTASASSGRSRPSTARGVLRPQKTVTSPDIENQGATGAVADPGAAVQANDEVPTQPRTSSTQPSTRQSTQPAPSRNLSDSALTPAIASAPVTGSDSLGGAEAEASGSADSDAPPAAAVGPSTGGVPAAATSTATPQAASVTAQPKLFSGLLSLLGLGGSNGTGSPMEFVTAALQLVRRELNRMFNNSAPTATPALITATEPGVVRGTIGGSDAEIDPLNYQVTTGPANGTVTVAADGTFTYTADEEFAATGGTDTFFVKVVDTGLHLSFWKPTSVEVPVTVVVNPVSSQRGAAAAVAATGSTTTITWDWGKNPVINFDPAKDKLDFGWMGSASFDVTEKNGSTVISVVDNQHSYTLNGVSLGQLSMTNIVAKDSGTTTKWQNLFSTATTQPSISIGNTAKTEGNSSTSNMTFTVTLSKASTKPVTVQYATANGTATAGQDYTAASGTITFAAGETSKTINVAVTGDTTVESDETFTVTLSNASGAGISTGSATGTISNDDVAVTAPTVSITGAGKAEGNSGNANMSFTVTLSKASTTPVTVGYATSNGTATAGQDYTAAAGTITFAAGETSKTINVAVAGDTTVESDETFTVTLSNANGATISTASATGTITNDDTATGGTGSSGQNSGNAGDERWGEAFYAPYVDMAAWPPPDLIDIARQQGVSLLTLAFIQANSDGQASWGGYSGLTPGSAEDQAKAIDATIAAFKAAGGDIMISFGGENGTSLAQYYAQHGKSAQELANAYGAVIDTYGLNRIDFDIEGAAVADPASIALNAQALKILQTARPDLEVWYTLPVLPSGLTAEGINVVEQAVKAGVKLDGINVMAMNFGASVAPTTGPNAKTMGAYSIDSAQSTFNQMTTLFNKYGQNFGWNQIGVTPMIGVNYTQGEVFTVADAQALEDFARTKGIGMLSMWSVQRDIPGSIGQATPSASGVSDPAGSFGNVWKDYGTINPMNVGSSGGGGGGTPVGGGTTTTIGWDWGQNKTLNFNPAKDKLDFGWMQPTHFDVSDATGSTVITIKDSGGQTYTLSGVKLSDLQMGNIVALDGDTKAKWQNAIAGAQPSAPTISIGNVAKGEGNSGTANMAFTVTLSKAATSPVTVNYATSNGTATAGQDYVATTGTVTFAAGETSKTINVAINGDATVESDETLTVTLSNPSAGATIKTATATGTITNDDQAASTPTISVTSASKTEGNSGTSNLSFTVTLSSAATGPVTVNYATSNGTATAGEDYTATIGTLTFAAGETSKTVNVAVAGDTKFESSETFTVTLSNAGGATIATSSATGTITNDDTDTTNPGSPGTLYKITTTGADIVGFDPAKDKLDLGDVSVHSFIVVDTVEGVGFRNPWTGDTLVLQGVSLGQLTIDNFAPIINDHLRQDLSGAMAWEHGFTPQPNTVYARSHEVGQIDRVAFNPNTDVVDFRYYGSREQISIIDSVEGVIISNAGTGQALILQGVTKSQLGVKNFVFHAAQVREDRLYEQLGIGPVAEVQVKDQGVPIAGTNNWPTGSGNGAPPTGQTGTTTVIGWNWGVHEVLQFDPAKDKLDFGWFQDDNFKVTEQAGSTRIEIVNNDQSYTLNGVSLGEMSTTNIVALDSDTQTKWRDLINAAQPAAMPTLSIADAHGVEGNSGTSTMSFAVTLSQASSKTITVGYTTTNGLAGAGDFTPAAGTLSFAPGETTKTINVSIVGDTLVELDENFVLSLSSPVNATLADGNAIGTIENDDVDSSPATLPKATISDLAAAEKNPGDHSHFMFQVTLDKASSDTITVNYQTADGTAVAGEDYDAASGTITFTPGVTSQTIHFHIHTDTDDEADETLTVSLSSPSGATVARGTAIGTILDDDAPQSVVSKLSVSDASVQEGDTGTRQMAFNVNLSAPSQGVVTVNYHTEDFTAAAGTDYQALEGVLTFLAGETSKQVLVNILGDATYEGNESLVLVLSNISGAEFDDSQGVGLITNDDAKPADGEDPQYRVVGYFAEWSVYARDYEVSQIQADKLTDINYAFADISDDGRVVLYDRGAAIEQSYPGDTWDQPIKGNFNQLAKLKEQNPDINVLISVGGWTLSKNFSNAALTEQSRAKFAASAIEFMKTYGFDGIDLDWEYPVSGGLETNTYRPEDTANYVLLVKEIRKQLDALEAVDGVEKHYLLTIAGPGGDDKIENYDLDGMEPYLDWFSVMAYDLHGASWEPNKTGHASALYGTPDSTKSTYYIDYAMDLYLDQVDPSKIVLGAPMYGHSWKGVTKGNDNGLNNPASGAGIDTYWGSEGIVSYWQIMNLLETQPDMYQVYWDDQAKASYIYSPVDGGTFISYESLEALQYKLDYIKELGLGGIMFWELDDDIRDSDDPDSLLGLTARELLDPQVQTP